MKGRAAVCTAVGRLWDEVCLADVGPGSPAHVLPLAFCPLKSFQLIILKTFYSMKNVNKFVITDALLWELLLCFN
jgi:hypothetical protein